jgi:hypothetical protein
MAAFEVSDPSELFLLQRALLESKFARLANDWELAGSPIVASLSQRASESCKSESDLEGVTDEWKKLSPAHTYWKIAVARTLADRDFLRSASEFQRNAHVATLLAPFDADASTVRMLLEEFDAITRARRWYQLWLREGNPFDGGVAFLREVDGGRYSALDASGLPLCPPCTLEDVGTLLIDRRLEPFGFFVEDAKSSE